MVKRAKNAVKPEAAAAKVHAAPAPRAAGRLPRRQPVMLLLSVVLFAVWFAFLLMTALAGS